MSEKAIMATLKVRLKPWVAPNFAHRQGVDDTSEWAAVPLSDLDDDALEDMALAWVRDLYTRAGRQHCPFYKPVKCEPERR